MKSFRNLFRSKKEEKENVVCIQRTQNTRLPPPAIKSYPKPPRLFADDMNLCNPAAAYHGDLRPATRRPLRSCPGDVISSSNSRHHRATTVTDSDDDDIPFKHEKRRSRVPRSHYGGDDKRTFSTRINLDSKQTSEYGSEDHSPISNVLKFRNENDFYYQKYRKYKKQAIDFYEKFKRLEDQVRHLENQIKTCNLQKRELSTENEHLKRQLQKAHNYNYTQSQYPSYYSHHHHHQQFAPPPPLPQPSHSAFPSLPPPPLTFSTAPTVPIEGGDEIKQFRRTDTDSKPLSPASFSSTSLSNFGSFKPDNFAEKRMNSQSLFAEDRENLGPSFSDNF